MKSNWWSGITQDCYYGWLLRNHRTVWTSSLVVCQFFWKQTHRFLTMSKMHRLENELALVIMKLSKWRWHNIFFWLKHSVQLFRFWDLWSHAIDDQKGVRESNFAKKKSFKCMEDQVLSTSTFPDFHSCLLWKTFRLKIIETHNRGSLRGQYYSFSWHSVFLFNFANKCIRIPTSFSKISILRTY